MMGKWRKPMIVVTVWAAIGALRLSYESTVTRDLIASGLIAPKLGVDTRDRIGQTSSAVALGGLRTLVATFLNLRAFGFFTEQKWHEVAKTFELMVDLAPKTRYYWETGAWHQAYNAASYYMNDSKLPALRRRELWRRSILAGEEFLERGIRNNPDDWSLWANLGFLLTDSNKFPAFEDRNACFRQAAEAYDRAWKTGKALNYVRRSRLYALARVEGAEAEALSLARELYNLGGKNRTPTLMTLLFVLEYGQKPCADPGARAIEIFGDARSAYDALSGHWTRTRERFPVHGVAEAIRQLETTLGIPPDQSILIRPPAPEWKPEDMFRSVDPKADDAGVAPMRKGK